MAAPDHPELSPELRAFLLTCIEAVEQIEMLLQLRSSPAALSVRDLAGRLEITDRATRVHLETMVARGLLQAAPGDEVTYTFAPRTAELARYTTALADAWSNCRTAVIRVVAQRSTRARRFADAFRLREPDA